MNIDGNKKSIASSLTSRLSIALACVFPYGDTASETTQLRRARRDDARNARWWHCRRGRHMHPTCLRVVAALLCVPASAQFGNLEVKWQMDESTGSKDATPSMGPPEPKAKLDGQTRASNLHGLSSEGLEGIVTSFGLSCETCTNTGHWISRVRSGGAHMARTRGRVRMIPTFFLAPHPVCVPLQSSRCSCASSSRTSKSADSNATSACSVSSTPCQKSSP